MTLDAIQFSVLGEIDDAEDVMRCVQNLILTPAGTIPLVRDFGIDQSLLDLPLPTAQSLLAVEIIEKVAKYEDRAAVQEVQLSATPEGKIEAKVVLTANV